MNVRLKEVEAFIKHFDALELMLADVLKEQSEIDKAISSWYHRVEGTQIKHVAESHRFMKEIIPLLNRRRDMKIESIVLRSTCDTLRANIQKLKQSHKDQLKKNQAVLQEIIDRAKE
jgi:CRISPR/Cas system CSM-associated protein Csm5 (group 7 of RAMP superfamily)